MKSRTVVQPFFLTKVDEAQLSHSLRIAHPAIKFLDDNRWPTIEPVVADSIDECSKNYVFLWPADIVKTLPTIAHFEEFEGPQSGVVMQFMRSRHVENCLLSGQIGVGFSDQTSWMAEWSRLVINALRAMNATKLRGLGTDQAVTGSYVVGPDALRFFHQGGELRHNSLVQRYEPLN